MARLIGELPPEEALQARRFHFLRDRATYAAAHVMLRRMLRTHLAGCEPRIVRDRLGRPELAHSLASPTVSFNLTHSRGFAACVISDTPPVGIDAEDIRRPIDTAEMAARWYAAPEQQLLAGLPADLCTEMFFRIWTVKEAILKATGLGLRIEPNRFAVDPQNLSATIPHGLGMPRAWRLAELVPLPFIRLAVAIPGNGPPLSPASSRFEP